MAQKVAPCSGRKRLSEGLTKRVAATTSVFPRSTDLLNKGGGGDCGCVFEALSSVTH